MQKKALSENITPRKSSKLATFFRKSVVKYGIALASLIGAPIAAQAQDISDRAEQVLDNPEANISIQNAVTDTIAQVFTDTSLLNSTEDFQSYRVPDEDLDKFRFRVNTLEEGSRGNLKMYDATGSRITSLPHDASGFEVIGSALFQVTDIAGNTKPTKMALVRFGEFEGYVHPGYLAVVPFGEPLVREVEVDEPTPSPSVPAPATNTPPATQTGEASEADPAEGSAVPAEASTDPAEGSVTPSEASTEPAEGSATPAEVNTPPDEGSATPAEVNTPLDEGSTTPSEAITAPVEGSATPSEASTEPVEGSAEPAPAQTIVVPAPPSAETGTEEWTLRGVWQNTLDNAEGMFLGSTVSSPKRQSPILETANLIEKNITNALFDNSLKLKASVNIFKNPQEGLKFTLDQSGILQHRPIPNGTTDLTILEMPLDDSNLVKVEYKGFVGYVDFYSLKI